MRYFTWIILFSFVFMLQATLLAKNQITLSEECKKSQNTIIEAESFPLSYALKKKLIDYKQSWLKACQARKKVNLHVIYAQAIEIQNAIEEKLYKISENNAISNTNESWKNLEVLDKYINQQMPRFLPAFKGSYIEHSYFIPRLEVFEKLAQKKGSVEDLIFFVNYQKTIGNSLMLPWYKPVTDYTACILFGKYNWEEMYTSLSKLHALKKPYYKKQVMQFETELNDFWYNLYDKSSSSKQYICTCEKKSSVLNDISSILKILKNSELKTKSTDNLENILDAISKNKLLIKSEQNEVCSGG